MALQGEAKAKYMQAYNQDVQTRVIEYVCADNFNDNKDLQQRMLQMQIKHQVEFYQLWHGDNMQCVMYSNKRHSEAKALEIIKEAGLSPMNDIVILSGKSKSDSLRYLPHLDDKDKKQYSPNDFIVIGNADPLKSIKWSTSEKNAYFNEIKQYIIDNNVTSIATIEEYVANNRILDFIYGMQKYQKRILALIKENAHKAERAEDKALQQKQIALQQQQIDLLMQLTQQQSKPSEDVESVSEDESIQDVSESESKTTTISSSVWAKFKCNQKAKLSEDEYWNRQQQDCDAMLLAQQQEEQERERQWLRGSGLVA